MSAGSLFQSVGAAAEKARSPKVFLSVELGGINNSALFDRRQYNTTVL